MFRPPLRVCCGQRHRGPVCPDGLVMCQLCFNRVSVNELATENGQPVDICTPCWLEDKGFKNTRSDDAQG